MGKGKAGIYLGILILLIALSLSVSLSSWYLSLLICVVGTIVMFFSVFEQKSASAEKIVLIAVLSALSAAGRVASAPVASVQPSSFIIIITGTVFGGETGFITGAITALASNLVLGQSVWTIWQMFCWGMMGLTSGLLSRFIRKSVIFRAAYSFVWGFVFGWIMNLYYAFTNTETVIAACVTSFPFDLAHAAANTVLMLLLGDSFIKRLSRIAFKYGLSTVKGEVL